MCFKNEKTRNINYNVNIDANQILKALFGKKEPSKRKIRKILKGLDVNEKNIIRLLFQGNETPLSSDNASISFLFSKKLILRTDMAVDNNGRFYRYTLSERCRLVLEKDKAWFKSFRTFTPEAFNEYEEREGMPMPI